ncbi:hypothetical protein Tco_1549599 [Tanacetum coccineum]
MEHVKKQYKYKYTIKSSYKTVLAEFDLKQALFDSLHKSKSFNKRPANKTLYHALMESLIVDENAIDQGVADSIKHKKRLHDDVDRDQDPPIGPDQGLKKRKTRKDAEPPKNPKSTVFEAEDTEMSLNQGDDMCNTDEQPDYEAVLKLDWFKKSARPPTPDLEWNTRKSVDDKPEQNWLNNLTNADNPPLTFNDLISTPIDFSAFDMNRLKTMELKYNMEECYRALSDQLDWNNPKGNRCPYDLNKPLPLHESQGHLTIPAGSSSTMILNI